MLSKKQHLKLVGLIEEYKEDFGSKYFLDDQGVGSEVDIADRNYEKSKAELEAFIQTLLR